MPSLLNKVNWKILTQTLVQGLYGYKSKGTGKGRFPPLLARVKCLQQVINCIAYVTGVEREGGEKRRDKGERIFPFP